MGTTASQQLETGENLKVPSPQEPAPNGSETLSPSDHLELLVELLRPGSIQLGRRLVGALMLVPEDQREGIVEAIEAQIVEEFGSEAGPDADA